MYTQKRDRLTQEIKESFWAYNCVILRLRQSFSSTGDDSVVAPVYVQLDTVGDLWGAYVPS